MSKQINTWINTYIYIARYLINESRTNQYQCSLNKHTYIYIYEWHKFYTHRAALGTFLKRKHGDDPGDPGGSWWIGEIVERSAPSRRAERESPSRRRHQKNKGPKWLENAHWCVGEFFLSHWNMPKTAIQITFVEHKDVISTWTWPTPKCPVKFDKLLVW